jgi:uncharacterized protein YecA (UPF0149 family)
MLFRIGYLLFENTIKKDRRIKMEWWIILFAIIIVAIIAVVFVQSYQQKHASMHTKKIVHPDRNELCSCGSGKKYKKCCMKKT